MEPEPPPKTKSNTNSHAAASCQADPIQRIIKQGAAGHNATKAPAAKRKTRDVQRRMKVQRALCVIKSPTTQPISKASRTQCVGCPRDIFRQALNDANHFTQFMILFCECVCNAQPHLLIVNPRCALVLCGRLQTNPQRSFVFSTQPTDPILGTLATNAVLACLR